MANEEMSFMLQVLSNYIGRKPTFLPANTRLDWNVLVRKSQSHQITSILFHQCKKYMPEDIRRICENEYRVSLYCFYNRKAANDLVARKFREKNISMVIVKGTTLAEYYPIPQLRTMGDTDIVVHKEDRKTAADNLVELGFVNHSHRDDKEWIFTYNSMEYELHDRLVYNMEINKPYIIEYYNDFWKYVREGVLDKSFHLLFLLLHLRGHFMVLGVGFRQFMDIALMCKHEKELNWIWIKDQLSKLNLLDFASMCFTFIHRWFDVSIPIEEKEIDDEFYDISTKTIYDNGVFGFDNENNIKNPLINAARQSNNWIIGMAKKTMEYVFPSYQMMKDQAYYPYIDGRKYLLPVAWIHRLIRGIWSMRDVRRKMALPSKKEIVSRSDFLEMWGL